MKRLIPFITAFIILFNIPLLTASSAVPTVIPDFKDVTKSSWYSDYYYGSILCWDEYEQEFFVYMFRTQYQYLNSNYILLADNNTYPSETPVKGPTFKLANQTHIPSGDNYRLYFDGYQSNPTRYTLRFSSYTEYSNDSLGSFTFWCSLPTIDAQEMTQRIVIASDVDLIYNDQIVYKGNAGLFQSYFPDGQYPYNEVFFSERPVYDPNAGQEGGGEFDTDYDEIQVETSKGILENVKNIITYIANLPANIANNIKSFFEQLAERIESGLNSLKNGIIDGLKTLFIPSDNAFTDIQDIINEKFGFLSQIKEMLSSIINASFTLSEEAPKFNLTIYGTELSIIDWSLYAPYRLIVHGIIIAIAYIGFIMRLIKRIPKIIGGIS